MFNKEDGGAVGRVDLEATQDCQSKLFLVESGRTSLCMYICKKDRIVNLHGRHNHVDHTARQRTRISFSIFPLSDISTKNANMQF